MPLDPNESIDRLLSDCAQQRREQAGDASFEPHPAVRAMLQGEAAHLAPRRRRKRRDPRGRRRNLFVPILRWIVLIGPVLAVVVVGAMIYFKPEPITPWKRVLPRHGMSDPVNEEPDVFIDRAQADFKNKPGAQPLLSLPDDENVASEDAVMRKKIAALKGKDGFAENEARKPGEFVGATSTVGKQSLVIADPQSQAALALPLAKEKFDSRGDGAAAAPAAITASKAVPTAALSHFEVRMGSEGIRFTDADGSVYVGKITLTIPPQQHLTVAAVQSFAAAASLATDPTQPNKLTPSQQTSQMIFTFRATGINRSTGQPVVVEGSYIADLQKPAARIRGTARFGTAPLVEIDALALPPEPAPGVVAP